MRQKRPHWNGKSPRRESLLIFIGLRFLASVSSERSNRSERETAIGIKVTMLEEKLRYPLFAALFIMSIMTFGGSGPIVAGEGNHWYLA